MSPRLRGLLWFIVPAFVVAAALAAGSLPSAEELRRQIDTASLLKYGIALAIVAARGGLIAGAVAYGTYRLVRARKAAADVSPAEPPAETTGDRPAAAPAEE